MLTEEIPAAEPASLNEAKAYLRVDHVEEDALVGGLIRTARALCEAFTGRMLIAREMREVVTASTAWTRLSATPVGTIVGVTDVFGAALPVGGFETDIDANGDGWVRVSAPGVERVRVTYRAGMAVDWNGVPEPLRQGIVRLVGHLYANRDGADDRGPPAAVAALWRPWRRMRLG